MQFAHRLALVFDGEERGGSPQRMFAGWAEPAFDDEPLWADGPEPVAPPSIDWTEQPGLALPPVISTPPVPPLAREVRPRFVPATAIGPLASPPVRARRLESRVAPAAATPPSGLTPRRRTVQPPHSSLPDSTPWRRSNEPAFHGDIASDGPLPDPDRSLATMTPALFEPTLPAGGPSPSTPTPSDHVATAADVEIGSPVGRRDDERPAPDLRAALASEESQTLVPSRDGDRSPEPSRVGVPAVSNERVVNRESHTPLMTPVERLHHALQALAAQQDAPEAPTAPTLDVAVESGDAESGAREDLALPPEAVATDHEAYAVTPDAVAIDEPIPVPEMPAARTSRRSRVEELPADPTPTRRAPDQPEPARAEPTKAGRAASGTRSPFEAPRETAGADQLFRPVDDGVDRSPAALGVRLAAAFAPPRRGVTAPAPLPRVTPPASAPRTIAPPVASRVPETYRADAPGRRVVGAVPSSSTSAPARPNVSTVPTPPDTARILTPLVGIDPSTVTVLQGPDATTVTTAMRADAVAVGPETVLVGPAFTGSTPRDEALLAHELTHVARARDPRFVPPIARRASPHGAGFHSEEDVARRVEARVAPLVTGRGAPRAVVEALPAQPRTIEALAQVPVPEPGVHGAADDAPHVLPDQPDGDEWGGLPAPWEPLPQWLAPSPSPLGEASPGPFVYSAAPTVAGPPALVSSAPGTGPSTSIHAAGESRMVETAATTSIASTAHADGEAAEGPDIDWLARQVYSALKRRLGAEARRENLL